VLEKAFVLPGLAGPPRRRGDDGPNREAALEEPGRAPVEAEVAMPPSLDAGIDMVNIPLRSHKETLLSKIGQSTLTTAENSLITPALFGEHLENSSVIASFTPMAKLTVSSEI
jgi:hypothetical protein